MILKHFDSVNFCVHQIRKEVFNDITFQLTKSKWFMYVIIHLLIHFLKYLSACYMTEILIANTYRIYYIPDMLLSVVHIFI